MNANGILMIALAFGGGFSLAAAIANWDFFFENKRAAFFLKLFGRQGARIFYGLLGLFLIVVAMMELLGLNE